MKRWCSFALTVLILCLHPSVPLSDTLPSFQSARLDASLSKTYSCDQISGTLVKSGRVSRIFSVKDVADPNVQFFTIVDRRGCHVTVPGFEAFVDGARSPMNESASPYSRPIMGNFAYSFEQRFFQEMVDSATAACADRDRDNIVQAYGASKYALCVERKVRWSAGDVELVSVYSLENGVQTLTQLLISRKRIEGMGKLGQDFSGNSYKVEFDFGVSPP